MAPTTAPMTTILNPKCLNINSPKIPKPTSLLPIPKSLTLSKLNLSSPLSSAAIASTIFSNLASSDAAFAAQQIADLAEGDNRGLALLLPIIPALAWVLFNILQPALNQINQMRNDKGVIIGLGLTGLGASGFISAPDASAAEIAAAADAASNDNRGQLILFVVAPAILWVLYNILQPALNQINRMRNK